MRNTTGRAEYTAISLPKDLMNDVYEYIRRHPRYRSLAEFTKISIIEKMQKEVVFNESLRNDYIFTKDEVYNLEKLFKDTGKSIKSMAEIHTLVLENNTMINQIKKTVLSK